MKKTIRKTLCVILAAVMAAGLLTITPRAARADVHEISGTVRTSDISDLSSSWLELILTGDTTLIVDTDMFYAGYISGKEYDLTIKSENGGYLHIQNNFGTGIEVKNLTLDIDDMYVLGEGYGIYAHETLTVEGEKQIEWGPENPTIYVEAFGEGSMGVYAIGDITINGGCNRYFGDNIALCSLAGVISVTGGALDIGSEKSAAMYTLSKVELSGGEINIEARNGGNGIAAYSDITLSGAEVGIDSSKACLYSKNGNIKITGGVLNATSGDNSKSAVLAEGADSKIIIGNDLYIADGAYVKSGTPAQIFTADGYPAANVYIEAPRTITVKGGKVTLNPSDWSKAGTSITAPYGSKVYLLPDPAPTGERFRGWFEESEPFYIFEVDEDASGSYFYMEYERDLTIDAIFYGPDSRLYFDQGTKVLRSAGDTRYETAIETADLLAWELDTNYSFDTIIVASGANYPDALSGSYLAAQKSAPILLVGPKEKDQTPTIEYVKNCLRHEGTVYILGGESAVAKTVETELLKITPNVKRLAGTDRIGTNIEILKEAGGKKFAPLLIADSANFADALSASALGYPLLLVSKKSGKLTQAQRDYITEANFANVTILGGKAAVPESIENEVKGLLPGAVVGRIAGANRYETSAMIADTFFGERTLAAVATGKNFPDGLSGGPLACALGVPLILSAEGSDSAVLCAHDAIIKLKAPYLLVFGGKAVLSDELIKNIQYAPKG